MRNYIIALLLSLVFSINAHAQNHLKQEITEMLSPKISGESHERPLLILIGGFPGSGKTTLINAIHNSYGSAVISLDAIRQIFLDKNTPFVWEIVRDVSQNLLSKGLQNRLNLIIDSNAHSERIKFIEAILHEEQVDQIYQVIKICLTPSYETLLKRVQAREQKAGVHQGTIQNLQNSMAAFHFDPKDYDLVIDTEALSFEQEWEIVDAFLRPYFDTSNR